MIACAAAAAAAADDDDDVHDVRAVFSCSSIGVIPAGPPCYRDRPFSLAAVMKPVLQGPGREGGRTSSLSLLTEGHPLLEGCTLGFVELCERPGPSDHRESLVDGLGAPLVDEARTQDRAASPVACDI